MSTVIAKISSRAPRRSLLLVAASFAASFAAGSLHAEDIESPKAVERFLASYCIDCHSGSEPGGDRSFESLKVSSSDADSLLAWQDIIDQLTLGEMPPVDADQPSDDQRQTMIERLTDHVAELRRGAASTGRRTVLRRLNRREYLNSIADLFDMDMTMFDPTTEFPADATVEHLDNVGDSLVTSGYLLEQYLTAADRVIEKAFPERFELEPKTWVFKDRFEQQPELRIAHEYAFKHRYLCLYDCPLADKPEGAYGPLEEFHEGVPADGLYEIRVLAEALHRDTPYDVKYLQMDLAEPFRMGVVPGNAAIGDLHVRQPIQPLLGEAIIEDGPPHWVTLTVPLDRGYSPRFTFENGQADARNSYNRWVRQYNDLLPEHERDATGIVQCRNAILKHGFQPQIRIHEVQVRGPLDDSRAMAPRRAVLGAEPFDPARTREILTQFASRAYRRPATEREVDSLVQLVALRREAGHEPLPAMLDGVRAILCSPSFLYLEPVVDAAGQASATAVASRLAYFLTARPPDDRLRELAASGEILQPETLRGEARRLLESDASDAFVDGFLDGWLNLRTLGTMPPDPKASAVYYTKQLQPKMRRETFLFTRHLIDQNLPITHFLSSDYTFVERDLAKLYRVADQVPVDGGHLFRKVTLDDPRRGGLFGQASVLTVTANGIETSPVIRGVWVLENILGTPPAPPPDDVPAIDPDVRGAASIRELLEKHRSSEACNSCHRKIDPLGFALESFDPIGRSRTKYAGGRDIDSSGMLPSGESFDDIAGLKALLLERRTFFARALTEKLLAYALGRRLEPADRGEVDAIVERLSGEDVPLRSLIEEVVVCELFLAG